MTEKDVYGLPTPPTRITSTSNTPPPEVVDAIEAGVVNVFRRVEFCEADAITTWRPEGQDNDFRPRLVSGTISVNYDSSERRTLDLTVDNSDGLLRPDPTSGLWYDKIVKTYRGVSYQGKSVVPRGVIIDAPGLNEANELRRQFSSIGFNKVDFYPDMQEVSDFEKYNFVVTFVASGSPQKTELLRALWGMGKNIITIGVTSGVSHTPLYTNTLSSQNVTWGLSPAGGDTPASGSFVTETVGVAVGLRPTALATGVVALAVWPAAPSNTFFTASLGSSASGAFWLDLHVPVVTKQGLNILRSVLNYSRKFSSFVEWEVQTGEFMIDMISEDNLPSVTKITGRDYTKRLIQSKVPTDIAFTPGMSLREIVTFMAVQGGANPLKLKISVANEVIQSEMAFSRGTDYWTIVKSACEAFNYEIFFDQFGFMVVRQYLDPTTGAASWTFKTGHEVDSSGANLMKYSRSISDSLIFNKVIVYGDPADGEERLPYYGDATNEDPNSPTSVQRIGLRTLTIETNWLSSNQECYDLALTRLKISALESYDITFDSIQYPWLECGSIVEFLDPERLDFEPTSFLLTSLTFPLDLGPMSATGKRVTFVNDSGSPESVQQGG